MKIIVRGISEEKTKAEVKAIIREFCERESVYAKADLSNKGNLKGVKIYPNGSKAVIGYIAYDLTSSVPRYYIGQIDRDYKGAKLGISSELRGVWRNKVLFSRMYTVRDTLSIKFVVLKGEEK